MKDWFGLKLSKLVFSIHNPSTETLATQLTKFLYRLSNLRAELTELKFLMPGDKKETFFKNRLQNLLISLPQITLTLLRFSNFSGGNQELVRQNAIYYQYIFESVAARENETKISDYLLPCKLWIIKKDTDLKFCLYCETITKYPFTTAFLSLRYFILPPTWAVFKETILALRNLCIKHILFYHCKKWAILVRHLLSFAISCFYQSVCFSKGFLLCCWSYFRRKTTGKNHLLKSLWPSASFISMFEWINWLANTLWLNAHYKPLQPLY